MFNPLLLFRKLKYSTSYSYAYKRVFLDKQLSHDSSMIHPFLVKSAFGGAAIYSLPQAFESSYCNINVSNCSVQFDGYCEHITYNQNLKSLYINPSWLILAPTEHIKYKTSVLWDYSLYLRSFVLSLSRRCSYYAIPYSLSLLLLIPSLSSFIVVEIFS